MKLAGNCALFLSLSVSFAQQKPAKPAFEVAAVRPSDPNPANTMLVPMSADPTVVRYDNISLRDAIRGAFRLREYQIIAPDWMSKVRFQIEGKLPAGASTDQIPEMLQTLLEERFKLETRRETKEMNVYALLVGKDGFKLKPSELKIDSQTPTAMGTDGKPRRIVTWSGSSSDVSISAPGANLVAFAGVTSRFTAIPVVDLTGLTGNYDFNFRFEPEISGGLPPAPPNAAIARDPVPSLSDALKPLGFRIEKRKMQIETLVITNMERTPTEN